MSNTLVLGSNSVVGYVKRLLPLAAAAALSVFITLISNYQYGTGDQIIHLPFVKYLLDPSTYNHDDLIGLLKDKPTYFWFIFTPLLKFTGIENGFLFLQLFSLTLFLFGVYLFCKEVTKSYWAGFVGMGLFILPKFSFGYSALFSTSYFIPRNFTVGFIILAVVLFLKNYKALAYFVLGLICNLHIISVVPMILSFLTFDALAVFRSDQKRRSAVQFIKYVSSFLLGFLPLLINFISVAFSKTATDSSVNFVDYYNSVLTPFYEYQSRDGFLQFYNAVLVIVIGFLALAAIRGIGGGIKKFQMILLGVASALVLASVFFERLYPNSFLLQLQLGRSGEYTTLVFAALFSYLVYKLVTNKVGGLYTALVIILGVLSPFLSPLFLAAGALKTRYSIPVVILALLLTMWVNKSQLKYLDDAKLQLNTGVQSSENVQAQEWLKSNTEKSAVVLAPYYIGGFTEPDFRTVSERTNVLTNADLVETILNANFLPTTKEKINDVTGGKYELLLEDDNLFNYYIGREYYHQNLLSNAKYLKNKYNINYVIIESDFKLKGNLVYENSKYKIYQL